MKTAVFSFFTLFLLLSGGVFVPEAKAFGLMASSFHESQSAMVYGQGSYLQEGVICPEQNPLLLNNGTEQQLQEEVRSCYKGNSAGKGVNSLLLAEAFSINKILLKENYHSFKGAVPIWLKVLSLRL